MLSFDSSFKILFHQRHLLILKANLYSCFWIFIKFEVKWYEYTLQTVCNPIGAILPSSDLHIIFFEVYLHPKKCWYWVRFLKRSNYVRIFLSLSCYRSSLFRSSHRRCSINKGVLTNFAKFIGKHLCQSLFFNKVAGLY